MARGLLCSPTPPAQIQGFLGAPPPDPWLHPNIGVGCAQVQVSGAGVDTQVSGAGVRCRCQVSGVDTQVSGVRCQVQGLL